MKKGLTLVLPAHNEGTGIRKVIAEIDSVINPGIETYIYVSEDGSTDDTRRQVAKAAGEVTNCTVILSSQSERLGYSKGVLKGIEECKTELIGFMDSDGQCDPKDLNNLLNFTSKNRVVCGYRNPRNDNLVRKFYSGLFRIAYLLSGGPNLRDPSSPFIICNTKDLKLFIKYEPNLNFGFWWEFQYIINKIGLEIIEIPITHRVRFSGTTQVYKFSKLPRIIFTHLLGLLKLRRQFKE